MDAITLTNLSKRFGPVTALTDVSLRIKMNEVVGIVGDNGAGKSTLLKILSGFHQPSSGTMSIMGEPVTLTSVQHARSLGIETVYQDLALVKELSVYENMFLGREITKKRLGLLTTLDRKAMREMCARYLQRLGLRLPSLDCEIGELSGGQRQAIAIARSTFAGGKILLLDEPLAAMGVREGAIILDLIRSFRARRDTTIIIIAHNHAQVLDVCDRVCLVQHGTVTLDKRSEETSAAELMRVICSEYATSV
jgi:ABC-type sugar transport system ATPase subunit